MTEGFDSIALTRFKLGAIKKNITADVKLGFSSAVLAQKYIAELNQCLRELAIKELTSQEFEAYIKTIIDQEN